MQRAKQDLRKAKDLAVVHYQQILAIIIVVALITIVYFNDLQIVANEAFQNDSMSYILLVPFLAGFLFYLKRDVVRASLSLRDDQNRTKRLVDMAVGTALCLAALILYWYGSYTFYPLEYHVLSLPVFLAGVTLILLNAKAFKSLSLPILFGLFLVPVPTELTYALGGVIGNFNTQASYFLLKLTGLPVTLQSTNGPPILALQTSGLPITFTIDMACSGIYTMTVFGMLAFFLAIVISASPQKKIIMFAVGFILLEVLNVFRISITVMLAHWFGQEAAMLLFHSVGGLAFIFLGMLITLSFGNKILRINIFPKVPSQPACPKCDSVAKESMDFCSSCGRQLEKANTRVSQQLWLKLVVLLLGCSIAVASISAPTFAIAQNSVDLISGQEHASGILPPVITYQNMSCVPTFSYRDTYYEKLASIDASLILTYNATPTLFVDIGVASSISNLHNWEVCLISWQTAQGQYPLVTVLESKDISVMQDPPITAHYLAFKEKDKNYTQSTLYWYERATFNMGNTVEQKYVRLSLVIYTRDPTNHQELQKELLSYAQSIASYWNPLTEKSLISLGVPTMQLILFGSIAFAAITEIGDYLNWNRKKHVNQRIFTMMASAVEKTTLQTILEQMKERKFMRSKELIDAIQSHSNKPIEDESILKMLSNMEEYGFLKRDIVSFGNRPTLVWKT